MSILGLPSDGQFIGLGYSFIDTKYFHSSLTYFGIYALIRRFTWRKDAGPLGSHFSAGRLVSGVTRKRLAQKTGFTLRTIKRALRALEKNKWIKLGRVKGGGNRRVILLGDRTKNATGEWIGESYLADGIIAVAAAAEVRIKAGEKNVTAPIFKSFRPKEKKRRSAERGVHVVPMQGDRVVPMDGDHVVPNASCVTTQYEGTSDRINPPNREKKLIEKNDKRENSLEIASDFPSSFKGTKPRDGSLRSPSAADDSGQDEGERHEGGGGGVKIVEGSVKVPSCGLPTQRAAVPKLTILPPRDYTPTEDEERPRRAPKEVADFAGAGQPPGFKSAAMRRRAERKQKIEGLWKFYEDETKLRDPTAYIPPLAAKVVGQLDNLLKRCGEDDERFKRTVRIAIWDWPCVQAIIRPSMTKGIPRPAIGDILFLFDDLASFPNGVFGGSVHRASIFAERYGRTDSVGAAPSVAGRSPTIEDQFAAKLAREQERAAKARKEREKA